jgi:hypothetical protein
MIELESNLAFGVFLAVVAVVVVVGRMIAGSLDRDRIREYVEERGGKIIAIVWNPLGPGWYGHERIYDVRYKTRHGEIQTATCKTGMFSGVYWTGHAPASSPQEDDVIR